MITRSDDISMILVVSRERDNLVYNCLTTSDRQYGYQIQQCESNSEALEISQQTHIDCILLDWGFSGLIEKKFLEQLIKNFIPMVILVNEGHENTGTDYLVKEKLTNEILWFAIDRAVAQNELKHKLAEAEIKAEKYKLVLAENKILKYKLQLEQAVNLLLQSIHNSFDLSTIFTAATTGVGKLLKLDIVQVSQYLPDREIWKSLIEYRDCHDIPNVSGLEIPYWSNLISSRLKQGGIVCINCSAEIDCNVIQVLALAYPGSWLIAPLIVGADIWGAISLASHVKERTWQNIEIDLVGNISTQIAIAIQQSISHQNLSIELQNRTETELELQELGSLLKAIFECSDVGIVIIDATGKFVKTNPCYQEMVGYSEIELKSMNFSAFTYPEDLPENYNQFMAVVRGEQNSFTIEKRYRHRNGSYLWVRVNCFRIDVPPGKPQLFIALIENISKRKSAETNIEQLNQQLEFKVKERTSALQASESRFKSFFDFAPLGIAVCDVQTYKFVAVNNAFCQLLGYTEDELLRLASCLTISDAADWQLELPHTELMMRGEINSYQIDKHYIKKNGELILGELTATLLKDEFGNITHILGMVRDISKQKIAELALNQQMERREFMMNITQQIRQSLNLDQVLTTAVNEVKRLLNCDRVTVFQLFKDGKSKVVKENVDSQYLSIYDMDGLVEHFGTESFNHYIIPQPRIVENLSQDIWSDCLADFMEQAGVKSKIVAPIVQKLQPTKDRNNDANSDRWRKDDFQLWGLLVVQSCESYRKWQSEESVLLQQLANQLAIAIQQADLYQQVQNELTTRKQFEQELKIQAAADRLLSEVTVAINESINLDQALNLILKKVQEFLKCDRIQIFQLDPHFDGYAIKEEVSRPELAIFGTMINDSCFKYSNVVEEYLHGKITILSDVLSDPNINPYFVDLLQKFHIRANIAVPIIHSYQLWGLLFVQQCDSPRVWLDSEVNLVKQVAAQIGISAQKEKLYSQLINELRQKKVLLKEIHHRVKNNLQVMSSLLRMQFRKTSPDVKILAEVYQNRIQSMALIHDQLYRSDDLSHIDFHHYISNLTDNLFQCYGTNTALVHLSIKVNNILIPLDQSIPLGLIINELVSNALKYAFPKGFGNIDVQLVKVDKHYSLTVSDDGIGIPVDFDLQNTDSLGIQLVQSLTEQLEGEFTYFVENGSVFKIAFPIL